MASNPPGDCCYKGVKHEGTATGEFKTVDKYETYFAYPPSSSPKHAILFITDVLGHRFINNQLIADQFAANGFLVAMPDLFEGDPLPLNRPSGFDMPAWRAKHQPGFVPTVLRLVEELKKLGAEKIGAAGYCLGAKYVVQLLNDKIDAGFIAHPSATTADEVEAITKPLSIAAAETDGAFPEERRHETEAILKKKGAVYQINLYSGVQHGFAVRGDLTKRVGKFAKEQAFFQAVAWFEEHLKNA
jgi:dienelactone hydrolase